MSPVGAASASRVSSERKALRLILCLDGTWNTADGEEITNIVRLRDMLKPGVTGGVEQRIYYDEGVGTLGGFDKYIGGGIGRGLDVNVRQAYRFLSHFYAPGDEIYIFGFSRGAFTARSLAGYIGASGLLRQDGCNPENEAAAWAYYRTDAKDRYPTEGLRLKGLCHEGVRVRVLGVFDTVGSLGIPLSLATFRDQRFQFHDTTLSSIIDHSLHAVAIDEKRRFFPPALWQVPQHANYRTVEQVWFPGVHSDIGGGYGAGGVGALTLKWMLDRIDVLNAEDGRASLVYRDGEPNIPKQAAPAALHESRSWKSIVSNHSPTIRIISQQRPARNDFAPFRLAALPPHARPIGEFVHLSALAQLRRRGGGNGPSYEPLNLQWALDQFFSPDHVVLKRPTVHLGFVGESGRPLDWITNAQDADALCEVLPPEYLDPLTTARTAWAASAASKLSRPSDEGRVGRHKGHEQDVRV